MANYFKEIHVASWNKLIRQYKDTKPGEWRWAFRGHSSEEWGLKPTLERIFNFNRNEAKRTEHQILREFTRKVHHYSLPNIPSNGDIIEWLALMQHHGSPTRLLDCTYSFFVGLHFAIEHVKLNKKCALWAIDVDWLRDKFIKSLPKAIRKNFKDGKDPSVVNGVFQADIPGVTWINSLRLNERQVTQQGLFLIQRDMTSSFEENIVKIASAHPETLVCKVPKLLEWIELSLALPLMGPIHAQKG